jgi:hypothetical protein
LHARANAFPPGPGVLTGKGVTAWRHALTHLTCATTTSATRESAPAAPLPGPVTTELVRALAGLAVALAGT